MTSYARLQRAAATLKRVRAGLDSLAAGAASEEERERLRRAAIQARVMYEGLQRRLQRALEQEAQRTAQAPAAPGPGSAGTGAGAVAGSGAGQTGETDGRATGGGSKRPATAPDGGVERVGVAVTGRRAASRRRAGQGTTPTGGQSGAR